MIRLSNDHPVKCTTCGEPSFRRQVEFVSSRGVKRPHFYDMHSACLRCNTHKAVVAAIDDYMEVLDQLEVVIHSLPAEAKTLPYGMYRQIDVLPENTDACTRPTKVKLLAEVGAYGFRRELVREDIELNGLTPQSVLGLFREEAEAVVTQFRSDYFDKGNF